MSELDEQDRAAMEGRCAFCGAERPAGQAVCPQCGHSAEEGYTFRLRRPIWVRVLIWVLLALFAAWIGAMLVELVVAAVRR